MLTPDAKGTIAEAAVVTAAVKLGIVVLKPVNDGLRYDLVFDVEPRPLRVQCKWALLYRDVVVVRCYSSRRSSDGFVKRKYTSAEVDLGPPTASRSIGVLQ